MRGHEQVHTRSELYDPEALTCVHRIPLFQMKDDPPCNGPRDLLEEHPCAGRVSHPDFGALILRTRLWMPGDQILSGDVVHVLDHAADGYAIDMHVQR